MGHLVQMAGLAVQNFVSAAVGIAVAVALIRGFARSRTDRIGNFWVDLVRGASASCCRSPSSARLALVAMGVVQNLSAGTDVTTVVGPVTRRSPAARSPRRRRSRSSAPTAAASTTPTPRTRSRTPTPLSNLLEIFLLLLIPVCLTRTFGTMVGDQRQGYAILARDGCSGWASLVAVSTRRRCTTPGRPLQPAGASMEGKETRFGEPASALFADLDHRHVDRRGELLPLLVHRRSAAALLILNMGLGEVAPGGVGSGLYGMLVLAILTVFVAGLMVGRTPEYLRKKITAREIKLVSLYILTMPVARAGRHRRRHGAAGPAGRRSSTRARTGSPRCCTPSCRRRTTTARRSPGSSANTTFYNTALGLAMLRRPLRADRPRARAGRVAGPPAAGARDRGHAAHPRRAVRRHARRRHRSSSPASPSSPCSRSDPWRKACDDAPRLRASRRTRPRRAPGRPAGLLDPQDAADLAARRAAQARPAGHGAQPGDVRRRGRRGARHRARRRPTPASSPGRSWSGCGSPWSSPTSPRPWPRAAARPRPRPCAGPRPRPSPGACGPTAREEDVSGTQLRLGDRRRGRGRARSSPATATSSRASPASTSRRSPASRPRSSASPAATAPRSPAAPGCSRDRIVVRITAKPGESFIDRMIALVEGAVAAEDAERDRAEHPAGQPDHHLPGGHRDAAAVRRLLRRRAVADRPGRAAGLPDPDHHRRAALGDRHRRAWTGWCSTTCWPCRAARSRPPAT